MKRRLEMNESGVEAEDADGPMRIVYLAPYLSTDAANRHTTGGMHVVYELDADLTGGVLEVVSAGAVTARYPLPSLVHGRHTMEIPQGIPLASGPYTFSCNLARSRYPDWTLRMEDTWDNPPLLPEDRNVDAADAAAPSYGADVVIASTDIPRLHNRMMLLTGRQPEVQILGFNFGDGDEVVCTKQVMDNPPIKAVAHLHEVRTVSTVSHDKNTANPVLRAGRFDVPDSIVAHGTFVRLVGKLK